MHIFILQVKAEKLPAPVALQPASSLRTTPPCPWPSPQRLCSRTTRTSAQSSRKASSSNPPWRASTCWGCTRPRDGPRSQRAAAARTWMGPRSLLDPGNAPTLWEICTGSRTLSRRIWVWSLNLPRKGPNQATVAPPRSVETRVLQLRIGLHQWAQKEGLKDRRCPRSCLSALLVAQPSPPTPQSSSPVQLRAPLSPMQAGIGSSGLTPKSHQSLLRFLPRSLGKDLLTECVILLSPCPPRRPPRPPLPTPSTVLTPVVL